jgi:hypothetical protein
MPGSDFFCSSCATILTPKKYFPNILDNCCDFCYAKDIKSILMDEFGTIKKKAFGFELYNN